MIVVIQCGSKKRPTPARADDLYTGSLFRAARDAARRLAGNRWFIVSAKHGLMRPGQLVVPYDAKLPKGGDPAWSSRVLEELRKQAKPGERIVALASADYCRGWADELGAEQPLEGLGMMKRIKRMKELQP